MTTVLPTKPDCYSALFAGCVPPPSQGCWMINYWGHPMISLISQPGSVTWQISQQPDSKAGYPWSMILNSTLGHSFSLKPVVRVMQQESSSRWEGQLPSYLRLGSVREPHKVRGDSQLDTNRYWWQICPSKLFPATNYYSNHTHKYIFELIMLSITWYS